MPLARPILAWLALTVGIVGGIYGIGGGSILGPILVGTGLPVARVAPAALASTFLTSIAGATTYAVLALSNPGMIAPNWLLGLACGLGGLIGGYLGARLQPRMPDRALTLILGSLAICLAMLYLVQAIR
ncbi:TSUP family transporter [Pseudonocardia sp. GCM10023141]|uniref:TSUP family transporter n=1 Tax=Pseudonocardia sp. GCM10023141 TaxID=3252653 RepID=UPI003616E4FD